MHPGDLVLTPNWTWHDHANGTDAPMIWLDGLDTPPVRMLEGEFDEEYHTETQAVGAGVDPPPQWHYPMSQARAALERLAAERGGSPANPIVLDYTNPVTGGPTMPTIACQIQLLRPGEHTQAHPPRLLREPLDRGLRLLAGGRQAARLGREGRVHGANLDLPRTCQHR